jgi:hypothetical protein
VVNNVSCTFRSPDEAFRDWILVIFGYKPDCTTLEQCRYYRVVVILFPYCPCVKDAEYFLFKVPELVSCNSISHVIFCWKIILPRQWKKISFQVVKKSYLIAFQNVNFQTNKINPFLCCSCCNWNLSVITRIHEEGGVLAKILFLKQTNKQTNKNIHACSQLPECKDYVTYIWQNSMITCRECNYGTWIRWAVNLFWREVI